MLSFTRPALLCLFACLFLQRLQAALPAYTTQQQGFIENKGQVLDQAGLANNNVLFLYSGNGLKLQLRRGGYSYELYTVTPLPSPQGHQCLKASAPVSVSSQRVDVDFLNMSAGVCVVKGPGSADYLNYYINGQAITQVHTYQKITYQNIYQHIDIEFIISNSQPNPLKYNLVLHPGANVKDIQFAISGAASLGIKDNVLIIETAQGQLAEKIPFSYYTNAPGKNQPVSFSLTGQILSFNANVDARKTLVIDPTSNLIWSTYYGGSATERCTATGVDVQNNVYLAGHTLSNSNIASAGAFQTTYAGSYDAYLVKFNASGTRQWATYFGGSSFEQIFSMVIDPTSNIYLAGDTNSPNGIASPGAFQGTYGGGIDDALLVKFDPGGQRLWSTYYGGSEHDILQAVTLDSNGDVIIAGHTESPVGVASNGAFNTTYSFNIDVLVAKFNSNGNFIWGTYYGDTGRDEAYGLATDAQNYIYVTGLTESISGIATATGFQPNIGGLADSYLAKFSPNGANLVWGTYYGGSSTEQGIALQVNKANQVILGGNTNSSNNIASAGAYQTTPGSVDDGFIACFNCANGARNWGTYFGGNNTDYIWGMLLDNHSNIVICGQTMSPNAISLPGAYQPTLASNSNYDAYFAKLSNNGVLKLGSYFGDAGNDCAFAIAADNTGKIYLAGETTSTANVATPGAFMSSPNANANGDAFLSKFCLPIQPLITPAGNATLCMGASTLQATAGYSTYLWNGSYNTNPLVMNSTTVQGTYTCQVYVTDGFGCDGYSDTTTLFIANCYVSLPELAEPTSVGIYPVPANDAVYINSANNTTIERIEIYAITGQLLSAIETNDIEVRVNIAPLPAGIYLLRVAANGAVTERKFIKE